MLRGKFRLVAIVLILAVVAGTVAAQGGKVIFMSSMFNPTEEAEKAITITGGFDGEAEFVPLGAAQVVDSVEADAETGEGTVDLVGLLHGDFPELAQKDLLFDLSDLVDLVEAEYDLADAFVELGKMGTEDVQYYVPWMQATYIMAANVEALAYLPEGADINALSWEELAAWGKNIYDATGEKRLGFPVGDGGLFHRFMEGYLYPSFTGGMVTNFNSPEAVAMFEFFRDEVWPYTHDQSITYSFMQEPLLAGEVWVAFDHTARLINAFNDNPDQYVAFPAPAGPAGRGFMPVVVGLGIPKTAANPEGAIELLQYWLAPETQGIVLRELGFFPIVGGVDTSDLPAGVAAEAAAVEAQATSADALPALLPVGLGERGGEINQIYRDTFTEIVLNGQPIETVLEAQAELLQTLLDETGAPCWPPDAPSEGACQIND